MQLETVGEIVRTLRARNGMEQVELARACGWRDASAVSRIETDRIRPTRRTLIKLADSLGAKPGAPEPREVRSWLFLASGLPPSRDEVDALQDALPSIDHWANPAVVMDFTWAVWRANPAFTSLVGLPSNHRGRNFLAMMFEQDGAIRRHLGERWEGIAAIATGRFRDTTEGKSEQRWFTKLKAKLDQQPDFPRLWARAERSSPSGLNNRLEQATDRGLFGLLRLQLTVDPRLEVVHIIPEDLDGVQRLREVGAVSH